MVVATVLGGACGGTGAVDGPQIVVTTTILGDVVRAVVGDALTVEVLLPVGADPHDFELSSRQVARMEKAELVLAIGLDLEAGMADVLDAVASDGVRVLSVGPGVEPDWIGDSLVLDPHIWMDPLRMALAADLIAAELQAAGLEGPWAENAGAFRAALEALDGEIRQTLDVIPSEQRFLVTNHESLGYFADRYGFEVVGVVVPGGSTLAAPRSAAVAELIEMVGHLGVRAIFSETTAPAALLDAIAAEPGLDVTVVELYVGSVGGPGSGAETYMAMLRADARLIAEALTR